MKNMKNKLLNSEIWTYLGVPISSAFFQSNLCPELTAYYHQVLHVATVWVGLKWLRGAGNCQVLRSTEVRCQFYILSPTLNHFHSMEEKRKGTQILSISQNRVIFIKVTHRQRKNLGFYSHFYIGTGQNITPI